MPRELKEIQKVLLSIGKNVQADFFRKAVPGAEKVYGVKTPELNKLATKFRYGSFDLAEELWEAGALEEKIIAIKIIEKEGKNDPRRTFILFKQFAKNIGNWAVCDGLGMQFLAGLRKTHTEDIFRIAEKFSHSNDPWQRRLALVMIEWYTRQEEQHTRIKTLVRFLEKDEDYYVKKAVTWINKNFSKGK